MKGWVEPKIRRKLRMSLGSRTSRRAGTKSRDAVSPRTRLSKLILEQLKGEKQQPEK
jgi:hypothetical protein